jgi:23S rRNA (cytosine1962-C5)-methyltransferase
MNLRLKASARRARVLQGHPWVFAGELEAPPPARAQGRALPLTDARGRHLGMGIVNSASNIVWRRYSRGEHAWDTAYWRAALQRALAGRAEEPCRRLVWSEADDLPGLVVDQFADVLVVQALTLAVDGALPAISAILRELLQPREIVFRNDAPARLQEGMPTEVRTLSGADLAPFTVAIGGVRYELDPQHAQKTGFYLDQRLEHARIGAQAAGRRVLDAFCNQGAFALHCARAGAREVLGLEISADTVALARRNAALNDLPARFTEANVFDWLRANRTERYDLIVLDPPSFARNRAAIDGALRGYKEINLRAMRMLTPGGLLATYCCSQHVDRALYRSVLAAAAADAGRDLRLLRETGQPPDHPVRVTFPESEYLKGALLQAE